MSSIDERVVEMKFNNSQFQRGVQQTTSALDSLKKGLNLDKAKQSVEGLDAAGKKFSLAGMASGIQTIASKFSALSIVGITALTNIANRAVDAGLRIAKSFTLDPIMDGFAEYELKMGSIQTILANTSRHGTKLDEVTSELDKLNEYADKTIYNFGDMTKNIGLFTNAGIKVGDATSMIKGFSNEAAASGTSAEGAAGAAYQLSQALSAGTIRLMDWRSLTNVGMGNKNMQNGIVEIADAMGVLDEKSISSKEIMKDFNGSLEKEWLSADVMQNYLKIQAGELTDAQMKSIGLNEEQIVAFKKQSQIAMDAATKVRTFTQLMDTLKEGVGSSWAETFDILIGDFDQATELWSGVSDTLGTMIGNFGEARNNLLRGWAEGGGREDLLAGLGNAFTALMNIIKPIGQAFSEIFPPMTAKNLLTITEGFKNFTESLKPSEAVMNNIKRTFKGVFAVLDIGVMLISAIVGMFADLFGVVADGSGGILDFTGNIGDFLVGIRDAIKQGEFFNKFFSALGDILKVPIELLKSLGGAIADTFAGASFGGSFSDRIAQISSFGEALQTVFDILVKGDFNGGPWSEDSKIVDTLFKIREGLEWVGAAAKMAADILFKGEYNGGPFSEDSGIVDVLFKIREAIEGLFTQGNFNAMLDLFNTGLLAGLVLLIKKFVDNLGSVFEGGGIMESITEVFGGLTDTLGAMQANLKAGTLIKIAGAVGILTASVVVLSMIDSAALAKALGALTIMFGQMAGAMLLFEKFAMGPGLIKMPLVAASLIILGGAVLIFAAGVRMLSGMSWGELAKGMAGMAAMLVLLAGATKMMSGHAGGLISASVAMVILGTAIKIFASAVEDFSALSWADMAKGLAGVGAVLGGLAIFTKIVAANKAGIGQGVGLVLLAAALKIIATVVKDFAGMSWDELIRGLVGMAGALVTIGLAMYLMPANMIVTAGALVIVAAALIILAEALGTMGGMSWEEIGKSLVVLAGSLIILAGAMYLMTGALPGAAALLVVSAALAVLAPVLIMLGQMSWAELGMGLVVLASAIGVLGLAALVLTPVVPMMMLMGAAILLIGTAVLVTGAGILMFATALTLLAGAGTAATVAIIAMVKGIISLIPYAMKQLGLGIIAFANVIASGGPAIVNALVTVLLSMMEAINTLAPAIVDTLVNLIFLLVDTLVSNVPRLVNAAFQLLLGILRGIRDNIQQIVTVALEIIAKFVDGITQGIPKLTQSAGRMVRTFIRSVSDEIINSIGTIKREAGRIAGAIVDGLTGGLASKAGAALNSVRNLGSNMLGTLGRVLGINSPSIYAHEFGEYVDEGLIGGLDSKSNAVDKSAHNVGRSALRSLKASLANVSSLVADEMDLSPTIRPVLDLSAVRKDARLVSGMVDAPRLAIQGTQNRASTIAGLARDDERISPARNTSAATRDGAGVTLIQNNNSPKALSTVDIYRQTKNLISATKGVVVNNA